MLVHVRITCPADLSEQVQQLLVDDDAVTNTVCHRDVGVAPRGDLIESDVAREGVNKLLQRLHQLGVGERGGIVISTPSSTPFAAASRIERSIPGDPEDAVIWESVKETAADGAVPTLSFLIFLVAAVMLASVAVITDSAVLVVGAMVVGPEFGAVAATCVGLVFGKWALAAKGLGLLLVSFAFAIGSVATLALIGRWTGLLEVGMITAPRPQTDFIWRPDVWSFVVALIAGTVGALALSLNRASAMVGVFISVTTVPAAGNLALGLALTSQSEIIGSLAQLGLNLAGMLLAGTVFLGFQRLAWTWLTAKWERVCGRIR